MSDRKPGCVRKGPERGSNAGTGTGATQLFIELQVLGCPWRFTFETGLENGGSASDHGESSGARSIGLVCGIDGHGQGGNVDDDEE
ncbi:hypothetical protein PC9H_002774, partial [Pleurotus ostreatus]